MPPASHLLLRASLLAWPLHSVQTHQRAMQMAWVALLLAPLLSACQPKGQAHWSGYVEGDYVYIAPALPGRLEQLAVQAGDHVEQGAALFQLDSTQEQAASSEAQARIAAAKAQAANIRSGKRPPEVAMIEAQLVQAQATAAQARSELVRKQPLVASGAISRNELDLARTQDAQASARVAELRAALQVAQLPARTDEQRSASAQVDAASAALQQNDWRVQQKRLTAPAAAQVADTYFRTGEYVNAGQPVLALLPPGQIKARFYVPEAQIASLSAGQHVRLQCDGCGTPIAARITRIATQAEYAPPVIYSNAQRATLVFMVEARPDVKDAVRLHPGQPLDVLPPEQAS